MARLLCAIFIALCLLGSSPASAAELKLNVAVSRQDDGTTTGELWFNDRVVWRLRIAGDGAEPVSGKGTGNTTVVVPDVSSGMFLLKVYNQ